MAGWPIDGASVSLLANAGSLGATTDAAGNFSAIFSPLPGEAGRYEIFATHPGVSVVPVQDTFALLGFRATPSTVSFTVIEGSSRPGEVLLENLSDVPLTGMAVEIVSKPPDLGVTASVILASTTSVSALLVGLERLRVPRSLVAICGFMIRYADVISGEMHRMKVARQSRGYDPRWFWQNRALAASAGSLFIRSYERGERVYLAMASRGFTGHMPQTVADESSGWGAALVPPLSAAVIATVAWALR